MSPCTIPCVKRHKPLEASISTLRTQTHAWDTWVSLTYTSTLSPFLTSLCQVRSLPQALQPLWCSPKDGAEWTRTQPWEAVNPRKPFVLWVVSATYLGFSGDRTCCAPAQKTANVRVPCKDRAEASTHLLFPAFSFSLRTEWMWVLWLKSMPLSLEDRSGSLEGIFCLQINSGLKLFPPPWSSLTLMLICVAWQHRQI